VEFAEPSQLAQVCVGCDLAAFLEVSIPAPNVGIASSFFEGAIPTSLRIPAVPRMAFKAQDCKLVPCRIGRLSEESG
jgi:hypothetical protein